MPTKKHYNATPYNVKPCPLLSYSSAQPSAAGKPPFGTSNAAAAVHLHLVLVLVLEVVEVVVEEDLFFVWLDLRRGNTNGGFLYRNREWV